MITKNTGKLCLWLSLFFFVRNSSDAMVKEMPSVPQMLQEAGQWVGKDPLEASKKFLVAYDALQAVFTPFRESLCWNNQSRPKDYWLERGNLCTDSYIIIGVWKCGSLFRTMSGDLWNQMQRTDSKGSRLEGRNYILLPSETFLDQFDVDYKEYLRKKTFFGSPKIPDRVSKTIGESYSGEYSSSRKCNSKQNKRNLKRLEYLWEQYLPQHLINPLTGVICEALNCGSLQEAGKLWDTYFCAPISRILQNLGDIPLKEITLEHFLVYLNLYAAYIKSDHGGGQQIKFHQQDAVNTINDFHAWLVNMIQSPEMDNALKQDQPSELKDISLFLLTAIKNYDKDFNSFRERITMSSGKKIEVPVLGKYQIELFLLGNKLQESAISSKTGTVANALTLMLVNKHVEFCKILKENRSKLVYQNEIVHHTVGYY